MTREALPESEQELALFAELRAKLEVANQEPSDPTLYAGVLESVRGQGRLRLVSEREREQESARVPAASRRVGWLVATGAVLAAAAAAVLVARAQQRGASVSARSPAAALPLPLVRSELVLAAGQVQVGAGAGLWPREAGERAVVGRGPLATGQHVSTQRGRACVVIDPQIDLCLGAESEIALESLVASELRVRVLRGTAVASLSPRARGSTFTLVFGAVSATARGTVFAVGQAEQGGTSVVVMEGNVDVTEGARSVALLAPHSRWLSAPSGKTETSLVGRNEEAQLLALIAPRKLWQDKSLGVLEVAGGGWSEASLAELGPLPLPLSAFVPVGSQRLALFDATGAPVNALVEVLAGQTRKLDGARLAPSAPSVASPSVPENAASLLDGARRELARGGAKAALPLYQRLLAQYPRSAEAATVLITVGQLELDQGAAGKALSAFDAYLKRGGSLRTEALAGKIRALRALGKAAEERAAIEQYLHSYPNGFEAPALGRRLGALR